MQILRLKGQNGQQIWEEDIRKSGHKNRWLVDGLVVVEDIVYRKIKMWQKVSRKTEKDDKEDKEKQEGLRTDVLLLGLKNDEKEKEAIIENLLRDGDS